jgi:hypothetical protein
MKIILKHTELGKLSNEKEIQERIKIL